MLRWLRNAGDGTRLDQELRRLGVDAHAFPSEMRRQLVQVAQNHIDLARTRGGLSTSEFQVFFDTAFELAAAIPTVNSIPTNLAIKAAGQNRYTLIVELIRENVPSLYGNLAKALYATCQPWMLHPNPEFQHALQTPRGEELANESLDLEEDDEGCDRDYETFEDWLDAFKVAAAKVNLLLVEHDGKCLIDFMDLVPLRSAFEAGLDPIGLGAEFGAHFDLGTFLSEKPSAP